MLSDSPSSLKARVKSKKLSITKKAFKELPTGRETRPRENEIAKKSATSKAYRRALKAYREKAGIVSTISQELGKKRKRYMREKIGKAAPGYVRGDKFYQSPEWKELRYKALKKGNGVCVCCGARKGGGVVLHVDHIKPRYKFPELSLELSNLQVLCADCNQGKGAWDHTEFKPWGAETYPSAN